VRARSCQSAGAAGGGACGPQATIFPVIVLARRIADDELHQLMQAGARDVIIKAVGRLLPAVERELAVAHERRAWIETREACTSSNPATAP